MRNGFNRSISIISEYPRLRSKGGQIIEFWPNQIDPNLTPLQQSAVGAQNAGDLLGDSLGRAIESIRIYQDCLFSLGYRRE